MDSLFISELTHLSIYIMMAEHVFSICGRKSYFKVFAHWVGIIFLTINHSEKNIENYVASVIRSTNMKTVHVRHKDFMD